MRKQLDPRIPILINNNVSLKLGSFIVLVGDKGRDQVVNLHFLLSQARVSARPSVLGAIRRSLGLPREQKFKCLISMVFANISTVGQASEEEAGQDQAGCEARDPRAQ